MAEIADAHWEASADHTDACLALRGGPDLWPKVHRPEDIAVIGACPHWSHDAFRFLHGIGR